MEDTYTSTVMLNEDGKPKLPTAINVLTILTFIGCGVGLLISLAMPALYKFLLEMTEKAKTSGKEFSSKEMADMEKGKIAMQLVVANAVPIIIISVVGIALCLLGAIWMRKLKKDGFWIYTAGELLPLIGSFIVLGTAQYTGAVSVIVTVSIPLIFIILYAVQRKYLVN